MTKLSLRFFGININLSDWNTLGFHPKPRKFFEKNLVKLLAKCNLIAFFVNPFAIFLKSSPRWGRCHASDRWGENNIKIIKIYPSSVSLRSTPSPRGEGLLSAILYLVPKYRDLSRYFTKSLGQAFSKACRVWDRVPRS